ncbi:hypothetical protein HML84_02480 [Alcanivorax sp. IO_7]|nr:hypothetical protein HML84_02480 [Alcanivorax sp. IO_7]
MTLNGERVEGRARMIARWPSGMPEALRLHSDMYMADQDVLVEQRLQLISQRHYPYPVRDWDVDPMRLEMQADYQARQFREFPCSTRRTPSRCATAPAWTRCSTAWRTASFTGSRRTGS